MSADLYTTWLQIPPGRRPPDYYALLGIRRFCRDQDVIEKAVRVRMDKLDEYSLHPDIQKRQAVQNMMNELAAARMHLVKLESKREYNATLSRAVGVHPPVRPKVRKPPPQPRDKPPRQIFTTRLRAHLRKWQLNPHEERLLVAEAAFVSIGRAKALRIIRRVDAEAGTVVRKRDRLITLELVLLVVVVLAGLYFAQIRPVIEARRREQALDRHVVEAQRHRSAGQYELALAELAQADRIMPNNEPVAQIRRDMMYERLLEALQKHLAEGRYQHACELVKQACKIDPDRQDAEKLRSRALRELVAQVKAHVAARRLSKGVEALAAANALAGDDSERRWLAGQADGLESARLALALEEVRCDLDAGNEAAAREKMANLRHAGCNAETIEKLQKLIEQYIQRLAVQFRQQFQARQWVEAAKREAVIRFFDPDANGQGNLKVLFGPEADQAERPDVAPEFAGRLLLAAADLPRLAEYRPFQVLLCRGAYQYGMKDAAGYTTAESAAHKLLLLEPSRLDEVRKMLLKVHEARYDAGDLVAERQLAGTLFRFLCAEFDDPRRAERYLGAMVDDETTRLFTLAGRAPESLPPPQRQLVGGWYRQMALADGLTEPGRQLMLKKAYAYDRGAPTPPLERLAKVDEPRPAAGKTAEPGVVSLRPVEARQPAEEARQRAEDPRKRFEGWMSLVECALRNDRPEVARTWLVKIICQYPQTTWAEEAEQRLSEI